jgi:hypothetical protein
MTRFEKFSALLQIVSVLILAASVVYSGHQISLVKRVHQDNHDWNRRYATQEALNVVLDPAIRNDLNIAFDYLNSAKVVPLDMIMQEFEKNPRLQARLHETLNYYERLAAGVRMGVLDERMVKNSLLAVMEHTYTCFQEYIDHRRSTSSRSAWVEYGRLLQAWDEDNYAFVQRPLTGAASTNIQ